MQDEDSRDKFRRILDESEQVDDDLEKNAESETQKDAQEQEITPENADQVENRHPTGSPTQTGGWYAEGFDLDIDILFNNQTRSPEEGDKSSRWDDLEDTPVPPPLGQTPQREPPAIGTQGMPLPRRVNQVDVGATRLSRSFYQQQKSQSSPPPRQTPPPKKPPRRKLKLNTPDFNRTMGCVVRMTVLGLFGIIVLGLILGSVGVIAYYSIARDLPSVDDLKARASQFETTRIYDRNGNQLYEILDPSAGRRTYVTLDEISPYLVAATVATEDKDFYSHPGFDLMAILRSFWFNFTSNETVSGASTITQQLTRALLFTAEERASRTYMRKLREAILAAEVTRRYSRDEILELYLNEIYFGNLAYGIEAASQTYFGISADQLNLAQASFLAGLPQLPAVYDVYSNRDVTLSRQQDVLLLMYQASLEQGCIYVSNNQQNICIGAGEAALAANELLDYDFNTPDVTIQYPHWVNFIRSQLEEMYGPQTIYRSGFRVYTTLDPGLQELAQGIVRNQVGELQDRNVSNGALVAVKPSTGEVVSMVGSADYYNEDIDGQINMALIPRQPGSTMKPLTYLAAFEKGWTPATLIWDVESEFPPSGDPNDPRAPYIPVNYDDRFHGPVKVRDALANSYNVPAVKALSYVGIYDDLTTETQEGLVSMAESLGITTLDRDDYGLSLTLGGGDVPLYELAHAYAVLANNGNDVPFYSITRIEDHLGEVVYQHEQLPGEQVVRMEHAYLITSIISDDEARIPAFGANNILDLPFPAAAKTGTTNDFRDNWTMGYTPDLVVGVWVGNADYSPMVNTSGVTGAAPIWAEFMQEASERITGGNYSSFSRPNGIVEKVICSVSGTVASEKCPSQESEIFAADQLPLPASEDLWKEALIDTWTGLEASPQCSEFTEEKFSLNVQDEWAMEWLRETSAGQAWLAEYGFEAPVFFTPERECTEGDPRPILSITSPSDGDVINEPEIQIYGQADATANFFRYRLEYGMGDDPVQWELLERKQVPVPQTDELYAWDISELPSGTVTLRLYLESNDDMYAETRITIDLQVPTPTPTLTPTASPTLTPSVTPTPTLTPTETTTPFPSETPTPTPYPIFTEVIVISETPETPSP